MDTTVLARLYSQLGTQLCQSLELVAPLAIQLIYLLSSAEHGLGLVAVFAPWLPTSGNRSRRYARDRLIEIIEGAFLFSLPLGRNF